jgi:hypothetical protein
MLMAEPGSPAMARPRQCEWYAVSDTVGDELSVMLTCATKIEVIVMDVEDRLKRLERTTHASSTRTLGIFSSAVSRAAETA